MKKVTAKNTLIDYVLETERDGFHREWATENFKGLELTEAYQVASKHVFMVAVIAKYGVKEYKMVVKKRWSEINSIK